MVVDPVCSSTTLDLASELSRLISMNLASDKDRNLTDQIFKEEVGVNL